MYVEERINHSGREVIMSAVLSLLRVEADITRSEEVKWAWFGAKEAMRLTGICHEDAEFDDLVKLQRNEKKINGQIMILPHISNLSGNRIQIVKSFVSQGGILITEASEPIRAAFRLKMDIKKSPDREALKIGGVLATKNQQIFSGITCEYLPLYNTETLCSSEYERYGAILTGGYHEALFLTRIPIGTGMLWCLPRGFFFTIGIILSGFTCKYGRQPKREEKEFCNRWGIPINPPIGFYEPIIDEWLVFWVNFLTTVADLADWTFPLVSCLPRGKRGAAVVRHDWDEMVEEKYRHAWAGLETKLGIPNTSLFLSMIDEDVYPMKHANYGLQDKTLLNWIESEKDRGCEIGIHHASWMPEVVKGEHRRFVEKTGMVPRVTTSHWTQTAGLTIKAYDELGYVVDGSLTSYDSWNGPEVFENPHKYPAFLTGTVQLHDFFDSQPATLFNIVEFPTFAEELWVERKAINIPSWSDIKKYFDIIERHQGACLLLWHLNLYPRHAPFGRVIRHLKKRNFWFTTMGNLAARWKNTRAIKLDIEKVEIGLIKMTLSSSNKIDDLTLNIPSNWSIVKVETHGETMSEQVVIHNREYTQLILDHLQQTRLTMRKKGGELHFNNKNDEYFGKEELKDGRKKAE